MVFGVCENVVEIEVSGMVMSLSELRLVGNVHSCCVRRNCCEYGTYDCAHHMCWK